MASFAGQMYMGMGMMRSMGGFGAMGGMGFDPMSMIASTGGFGQGGLNFFDPRAMAMSSMAMGLTAGGIGGAMSDDPSDGEVYQTVSEAFENIAKAATEKIAPRK